MGVVVGLVCGAGLFLIWWSCWDPGHTRVARTNGWTDRARDTLAQAGMGSLDLPGMATLCLSAGGVVFGAGAAATGIPAIAASFAVIASAAPLSVVAARARRRRAVLLELWPEAIDNLTSAIRAGMSLSEALTRLGERGPVPLQPAFRAFTRDLAVTGRFDDALDGLKGRLADPVADRVCEALRIAREVGGTDLGRLLRTLSGFLRDEARTRAELQARQSWTVYAARLAVAAPWLVLALIASRPQSVAAYDRPAGAVVLGIGGLSCLVAYRLMVRIGRLPTERRLLR
jgi:tight adherence protein B